ncbi:hypothetical protein VRT12_004597 [Citrobacter koseri]|nr:hypothetical protein [Citrobacter koseri]
MRLQEISQLAASPDTQSGSNPYRRAASPGLFAVARRRAEYQALQIDREKKHGYFSVPHKPGDEANFDGLGESVSMKSTTVLEKKLEAAEKRIADQQGIILSARQFISEYAASGDVGADEFVKVIDRAAGIGKGE